MSLEFEIQDMTCGHCVRAITEAVIAVAPDAEVTANTETHRVSVKTEAQSALIESAIREAGYTPEVR